MGVQANMMWLSVPHVPVAGLLGSLESIGSPVMLYIKPILSWFYSHLDSLSIVRLSVHPPFTLLMCLTVMNCSHQTSPCVSFICVQEPWSGWLLLLQVGLCEKVCLL